MRGRLIVELRVSAADAKTRSGLTDFALARRLKTPVWVFDIDNNCIPYANAAACELWRARDEADLQRRNLRKDMSPTVAGRLRQYQSEFLVNDASFSELWTLYPRGEPITTKIIMSGFTMPDARMAMLCEVTGEVADEPQTLRSAEALLHTDVMITLFSSAGAVLYSNPAAHQARPDGAGTFQDQFVDRDDYAAMEAQWLAHDVCRRVAQMNTKAGVHWYDLTAKRCLDAATGQPAVLVTAVDVSELKTARDQARYLADRDQLTGCFNRSFITQQIETISKELAGTDRRCAVLFIDIDNFKTVNDGFGHEIGDMLLRTFAQRVQSRIRQSDIIARMGGDEFLVLIEDVSNMDALLQRLDAIQTEASRPLDCGGVRLNITASIGVSLIDSASASKWPEIIKQADIALYSSKRAGRNQHTIFNAALGAQVSERNWLETELKKACDSKAFALHYQPRIDLASGRVVGVEALLRWPHPARGYIPPDDFIPISEKTGLIDELGAFVLAESARDLAQWHRAEIDIGVSINVSPIQFRNPGLLARYREIVETGEIPSERLELEITESSLFGDDPSLNDKVRKLLDLGFRLALDDFGTGYSNLAHISRFPISCIKIDKTFVQMLPSTAPLLRLILTLARQIGATTVAEGVENVEQLRWLADEGCDQVQGFLFSRAVAKDQLAELIPSLEAKCRSLTAAKPVKPYPEP